MPRDLDLQLRIRAQLGDAIRDLRRLRREVDRAGDEAQSSGRQFERGARGVERMRGSSAGLSRGIRQLRAVAATAGGAIAALGIGAAVREFVRATDELTEVRSRLRLVTDGAEDLAKVEEELLASAQRTRTEYAATADLYARLARSTDHLERSQGDLLRVTEAVNQAVRISGATSAESTAGIIQFAQGLASGRLQGEELRSVLEQMPRLARAIADSLGVSIGDLRQLAAEGELTAERVFRALLDQAHALESEFGQVERTVGQALTQLGNEVRAYAGEVSEAEGVTRSFVDVIDDIREAVSRARGAGEPRVFADVTDQLREAERAARDLRDRGLANLSLGELFDLRGLEVEIERLRSLLSENIDETLRTAKARLAEIEESAAPGLRSREADDLRALIARAEAIIAESDRRTDQALREERGSIGPPRPPAPPEPDEASAEYLRGLERQAGLTRAVTHEERARFELRTRYKDATDDQREAILAEARDLDALEAAQRAATEAEREAERQKRRTGRAREEARRAVADASVAVLNARGRDLAMLDREEAQLRALIGTLDRNSEEYENAVDVIDRYIEAKERAVDATHDEIDAEEELRRLYESEDPRDGARRALLEIEDIAGNAAENVADVTRGAFQGMEDALVRFVETGKLSVGDLVDSIIADLARLAIRQGIVGPLAQAFGSLLFGGGGGTPSGTPGLLPGQQSSLNFLPSGHAGGIVGALQGRRLVSPEVFRAAPRLHRGGVAGLRSDEVPTILRRGEGVFTPEQMARLGRSGPMEVIVVLRNESGAQLEANRGSARMDEFGRLVVSVLIDDIGRGGRAASAFEGTYGLRRQTA